MKLHFILLLLLIAATGQGNAQLASNCTPTAYFRLAYERDARDMAVLWMYESRHPDTAFVAVPQEQIDTILEGLAAIYNLGGVLGSDTPLHLYCIHNQGGHATTRRRIELSVDTAQPWIKEWLNGQVITANAVAASVVNKYSVRVTNSYHYTWGSRAMIVADSATNIFALSDSLDRLPGVSGPNIQFLGSGHSLSYKKDSVRHFDLFLGWSDCVMGCMAGITWSYTVAPNCSVRLDSIKRGSLNQFIPIPSPPGNCSLLSVAQTGQSHNAHWPVSPNPSADHWRISLEPADMPHRYLLMDAHGRHILEGRSTRTFDLDAAPLTPGHYFLRLENGSTGARQTLRLLRK